MITNDDLLNNSQIQCIHPNNLLVQASAEMARATVVSMSQMQDLEVKKP